MDQHALIVLNAMLGNENNVGGIEWALTGGALQFEASTAFAIGGADTGVSLDRVRVEPYRAYHASAGQSLVIDAPNSGRFLYLGFAGGIHCESIMRSTSTYVPGVFGGIEGRKLTTGDVIEVRTTKRRSQVSDPLPHELRPSATADIHFVPRDSSNSFSGSFVVSSASDRTGYRLVGSVQEEGESITSEGVCPGTIQLPPGGEPIVLMADAPTIGGYRIMGAVITADLGKLAQRMPGASANLIPVSVHQAQRELSARRESLERIREWALT